MILDAPVTLVADRLRLSESVYESLLELILTGELIAGEPVSELELTRRLGVSRTPVHEAIRQLIYDGLVLQQANHRPVVARYCGQAVHEVFEMRMLLEGEAASRAAKLADRLTLASLRQEADHLTTASRGKAWLRRWTQFDDHFHTTIAKASGFDRLTQDIIRYRRLHRFFNNVHTTCEVLEQALSEHLRILDALDRRDANEARAHMVEHIHEWQRYFVQQIAQESQAR